MPPGKTPRRRAAPLVFAAVTLTCAAVTPLAAVAAGRSSEGPLSARLAELTKPAVRLETRARQAKLLGLPVTGPGSLLRDGNRVLLEVRFDRGAAAAGDRLRGTGAEIIDVSRRYQTVTVAAKPGELSALSEVPRVAVATEVLTPIAAASTCPSGVAVSEGDAQLRAAEARSTFGVDGSGVEVGILSDSFDQDGSAETSAANDVESGDLPGASNTCTGQSTPVDVLEDFADPEAADEGRAMAQIVHDLAPGASLSFATAFTGMTAFAGNIEDLAAAGADVIADDVSYFEEPFFQEGPVGVAVSNVTAAGVSYFSSAANNNLISSGNDIASWEAAEFRDGACPAGAPAYAAHCMDFDPEPAAVDTTFGVTVSAGATLTVDLQWAQPWNGVSTDLDVYLLDSGNAVLTKSEFFNVSSTQRPFEFLIWENSSGTEQTVRIAINRCDTVCDETGNGDGGMPRLKLTLLQNGGGVTGTEFPESSGGDVVGPTIFGHNGAAAAISVGAVRYNTTFAPESFSSRGPVTHYFGPVGGTKPAPPLGTPLVLAKPDVAATDGGANTFFGSFVSEVWRFFGTSASAPHAAAVAALMRDAKPSLSSAQVRAALTASAQPVGAFGPEAVGAGLVDAFGALDQVTEPGEEPEEEGEEEKGEEGPAPPGPVPPSTPRAAARRAPSTFFRRHSPAVLETAFATAKAVFRFGSDEAGVSFLCKFDRAVFRGCRRRIVWHVELGRHVLRAKARDADGNVDPSPAVFRFRVERVG